MLELFDIAIFLGVLGAMLFSSQPKREGMAVCVAVSLFGLGIAAMVQEYSVPDMIFPLQAINETAGAVLLIALARRLQKKKDKDFFHLMAAFLMASCFMNGVYIPIYIHVESVAFWPYLAGFKAIAIMHVVTMLMFADGITNFVGSIRDNLLRSRHSRSGM